MASFIQPRKSTLTRQLGERNLLHGIQKRMWQQRLKNKKRNANNLKMELEFDVQNINNSNLENIHVANISGSEWNIQPGNENNFNNTKAPRNLLPGRRNRKTRKQRRRNSRTRKNRKL